MNGTEQADGVLLLNKPAGPTSFDCVAAVRRLYGTKKVGHTGTLDPMASGVLPILIGRCVKASEYLTAKDKYYKAVLRLGAETDTEDTTGTVLRTADTLPAPDAVIAAAARFLGQTEQIPPMYAALKVGGQKLCDLARRGITVERAPRPITVYGLSVRPLTASDYELSVHCSKGTYIRTLCADIGRMLGCGGVMAALERTQSGPFSVAECVTLDALEAMTQPARYALLRPTESLFSDLPVLPLPPFFEHLVRSGLAVALQKLGTAVSPGVGELVRLYGADGFFALGMGTVGTNEDETAPAVRPVKQFVIEPRKKIQN